MHFALKLNILGQDKLPFTMEIISLYTVIPNDEGLLALNHLLISGVAMGTKMGPSCANLFVSLIEHQFDL